eukprot:jgi/Psemu1/14743/gm1.14743_g
MTKEAEAIGNEFKATAGTKHHTGTIDLLLEEVHAKTSAGSKAGSMVAEVDMPKPTISSISLFRKRDHLNIHGIVSI